MNYYLKQHGLQNVWCDPSQDTSHILEACKITPINGINYSHKVMQRNIVVPNKNSRWHYYYVGLLHPLIIGLPNKQDEWISFAQACKEQKMTIDVYSTDGVMLPRFDSYYMYTRDNALVFAMRYDNNISVNLDTERIFVRFYTNQYFKTLRANQVDDFIHIEGARPKTTNEVLILQSSYLDYKTKNGVTYCFVNGVHVDDISPINVKVGDVAEFVYDSSVIKTVEFRVGDLNVFDSTLDQKAKYILHYSGEDNDTIDFYDDIDIFVLNKNGNRFKGLFYHRNSPDALRNLTHRDYSICTTYVNRYTSKLQSIIANETINPQDLIIKLHIRKSGNYRPLVNDSNRIQDLYKLTDTQIIQAMASIDAVVPNWKAENLETSAYTELMKVKDCCDVTSQLVEDAYGYNTISKLLADNPVSAVLTGTSKLVDVPVAMRGISTVYEYDNNGYLLGYYPHQNQPIYVCTNATCARVEFIRGAGGDVLNETFGTNNVPVLPNLSYRVYACNMTINGPDENWIDVTGTDKYLVNDNKIIWADQVMDPYIRVRYDNKFYAKNYSSNSTTGELKFILTLEENRQGIIEQKNLKIPLGEIDVFLNGNSLIEKLDYIVKLPAIVIINKKYLIGDVNTQQNIHVRYTGFCNEDFESKVEIDAGFIEHGYLSNNNVYNLRQDHVLRIVVDGQLKTINDVEFSEDHSGVSIINVNNGLPYMVREMVTPLYDFVQQDTYVLLDRARETDSIISNYLNIKIPQPPRDAPSAIPNKYQVYSPFINKILFDLKSGLLDISDLTGRYSDNAVITKVTPYHEWLEFDPITSANELNKEYVIIHPHFLKTVIDLNLYQYEFIKRVVKLYSNGLVEVSPFLTLT